MNEIATTRNAFVPVKITQLSRDRVNKIASTRSTVVPIRMTQLSGD